MGSAVGSWQSVSERVVCLRFLVRQGAFKLIEFLDDERHELVNLHEDMQEKTNLAERLPEKVAVLRKDLVRWRLAVGAQMPVSQPGKPAN